MDRRRKSADQIANHPLGTPFVTAFSPKSCDLLKGDAAQFGIVEEVEQLGTLVGDTRGEPFDLNPENPGPIAVESKVEIVVDRDANSGVAATKKWSMRVSLSRS